MTSSVEKIYREAKELNPVDRAELVENLLTTFNFPHKDNYEKLWAKEVENRIKAFEEGKIKARSVSDVITEIKSAAE